MSSYTMQLRNVCQALNDYTEEESLFSGFEDMEDNITSARGKIFSFSYSFYNDNALLKTNFEKKFIRHFYTREIGSETFGLFQLRLKQKFDMIMPYYKELYNSIIPYDIAEQLFETTTETSNGQYRKDAQFLTDLKNTGTQSNQGTNTGTVGVSGSNTGTVGYSESNTGTIGVQGTNTGTVSDSGTNTGTQRNIGTTEEKLRYMDTPQGSINIIGGAMGTTADTSGYLTNAHWNNTSDDNTRTDNLAHSNTRTDNLTNSSTTTNNLSNTSTTTNNLSNTSTTTNNLSNSNTRTDNLEAKTTGSNSDIGSDSNVKLIEYCGTKGKTISELIQEYRDTIINIDESIFNECNDLFMLVY